MRTAFIIFGAVLMAGSATQVAAASEHHPRHGRGHERSDYRRGFDRLNGPATLVPQAREGYGNVKPPASETRTCDRLWCYTD